MSQIDEALNLLRSALKELDLSEDASAELTLTKRQLETLIEIVEMEGYQYED